MEILTFSSGASLYKLNCFPIAAASAHRHSPSFTFFKQKSNKSSICACHRAIRARRSSQTALLPSLIVLLRVVGGDKSKINKEKSKNQVMQNKVGFKFYKFISFSK